VSGDDPHAKDKGEGQEENRQTAHLGKRSPDRHEPGGTKHGGEGLHEKAGKMLVCSKQTRRNETGIFERKGPEKLRPENGVGGYSVRGGGGSKKKKQGKPQPQKLNGERGYRNVTNGTPKIVQASFKKNVLKQGQGRKQKRPVRKRGGGKGGKNGTGSGLAKAWREK